MDNLKRIWKSTGVKILVIVVLVLGAYCIRTVLEQRQEKKEQEKTVGSTRETLYAEPVKEDNAILQVFCKQFPDAEVILACEEDVTDDGFMDLVVIYLQDGLTRTVVAVDSGEGTNYNYSEPVPGPIENQKIQFKNIDKEAEIEIIITGEKKGAVGYAVYRMIDGQPVDLFGEGMEDCC